MEYMTTSEMAEKWNVSRRWVTVLCTEGRIKGAIIKGKTWLIPSDTEKPADGCHLRKEATQKKKMFAEAVAYGRSN